MKDCWMVLNWSSSKGSNLEKVREMGYFLKPRRQTYCRETRRGLGAQRTSSGACAVLCLARRGRQRWGGPVARSR